MTDVLTEQPIHVMPSDGHGQVVRGHEARIDCPACRPVAQRNGPLDVAVWVHVEPTWPGADPSIGAVS